MLPGTSMAVPVRSAPARESRNATRSAASAALANRRSAMASVSRAVAPSSPSGQMAVISARLLFAPLSAAGTTALARMPYRRVWLASALVNPMIPARAAPGPRSGYGPAP